MIKVTVTYEDSINHFPSYKKIITKKYFLGILYYTRIENSDAVFMTRPRHHRNATD